MNETEIRERMATLVKEQNAIADAYPSYDVPDDVWAEVRKRDHELSELTTRLQELGERKGAFDRSRQLGQQYNQPAAGIVHAGQAKAAERPPRSISEQVIDTPEWKGWFGSISNGGHIPQGTPIKSPVFSLKTLVTGDSSTSAGGLVFPDIMPGFIPLGRRPLVLRDVVTVARTGSDTVEYVQISTETNNAATVAEATATGDGSGVKPESAVALAQQTANVVTVAHWIPVTKRALADAGQMRGYLDNFLIDGVNQAVETKMVTGAGGSDILGLANTTGLQTDTSTGNLLTLARRARRKIRTVGRDIPTAFVYNPVDWEGIDLLTDNENRYYFGGPREIMNPYLWGLPVVESEAVTTGTAYVGNMKKAYLWDREQANIQVSDSHSDFFIRNLIAILAEGRYAFGVVQPTSILKMTLTT